MWERLKRLVRHRWMEDAHRIIDPAMLQRLKERVAASEAWHTGEIRICIESGLPNSYLLRPGHVRTITRQRALAQFGKLRVWDTEHNNGVLIYLLLAERAIEIVADRGLDRQVAPDEWRAIVARMSAAFREGRFEDGLTQAIAEVTAQLAMHFPAAAGDSNPNELPDAPVLG